VSKAGSHDRLETVEQFTPGIAGGHGMPAIIPAEGHAFEPLALNKRLRQDVPEFLESHQRRGRKLNGTGTNSAGKEDQRTAGHRRGEVFEDGLNIRLDMQSVSEENPVAGRIRIPTVQVPDGHIDHFAQTRQLDPVASRIGLAGIDIRDVHPNLIKTSREERRDKVHLGIR
jgi:hypothetical protein